MRIAPARPARFVIDANILVSAVIVSDRAFPAALRTAVDRALAGGAIVITCPLLLTEVERALRSPRLARWIDAEQVDDAMAWIVGGSRIVPDPETAVPVCRDSADDYLVALARREDAAIVTGDRDLLVLRRSGIDVITVAELAVTLLAGG